MKSTTALAILATLAGLAKSVDMSEYAPSTDVDTAFQSYLQSLYTFAEDHSATTTFTDFFVPTTGTLVVVSSTATGSDAIIALKQELLPANKSWNHFPNTTTVYSESDTDKVFLVFGRIESTFTGGNCSSAYYQSRFTVEKGDAYLVAHGGSLVKYDDYAVDPGTSPTDIPCGGGA